MALLNDNLKSPEDFFKRNKFWALLLLPLAIYFYFGLQHLAQFETADEHYWIYSNTNNNNYWDNNNGRIEQYWSALASGNWKKTRINDKPGITLAYVSGIGSWLKTNLEKGIVSGAIAPMSKIDKAERINFYFRFPLLIFNGLFSLVLFFLVKKLTKNDWIALITATLILLSPILLGISQIINPDSLLWVFSFAAILTYLIHLKENSLRYALWASLFLGLSLLSKYSSIILFPFFFAVMLAYLIENFKSWGKQTIARKIRRYAFTYFLIIAGALFIYAVLLPDNLVEFRHFMKGSLGFKGMQTFFLALIGCNLLILLDAHFFQSKTMRWVANTISPLEKYFKLAIFTILPILFIVIIFNTLIEKDQLGLFITPFDASLKSIFSQLPDWKIILKQFLPLIFSLSPMVVLFLLYAWIRNWRKSDEFQWIIFVFSFFILVLVAASMQQKIMLIVRYSIMLYPLVFTMAAIGIYQFFMLDKKSNAFKTVIFTGIILISIISLWQIKPFYFNYTSRLLPQQYLTTDAWGYGGYEAAEYLNSLPDAQNMRIWSDYNGVCLFFNGKCEANNLTMKNIRKKSESAPRFDYFVSDRRGSILSHNLWESLPEQYGSQLIQESNIGGRAGNFIRIYKNNLIQSNGN
ncbi:MAG: glycosyltransferase family 39 protein [Parcubacteria group bacterium]|jgi:4-amino-4-deoxy-L-arabinose transferase-like glycosyltransferase